MCTISKISKSRQAGWAGLSALCMWKGRVRQREREREREDNDEGEMEKEMLKEDGKRRSGVGKG